jgi:dsDNA-specific endonuclease/ATPase MutS2
MSNNAHVAMREIVDTIIRRDRCFIKNPPLSQGASLVYDTMAMMQAKAKPLISKGSPRISTDDESRLFAVELGNTSQIDLHGLDPHSAIIELDHFLNRAFAQNEEGVRVIHGLGTGALRTAVHAFLKKHSLIQAYRNAEHHNQQGGMTVAIFKI